MKKLSDSIIELDCLRIINNIDIKKLSNSKILILGANGFLARYILSVISFANNNFDLNCKVLCSSYSKPKSFLKKIIIEDKKVGFLRANLNNQNDLKKFLKQKYDFIFHCATYGQPSLWMKDQLSTINLNTSVLKFF